MKKEWKKEEKELYLPKEKPILVNIPKMKYFTITGRGNPNDNKDFQDRIGALYSLSYTIKMMPKSGDTPDGYYDYVVYPLEGIWDLTDEGRKSDKLNKEELVYKLMIRQPDFVNNDVIKRATEKVKKKGLNPLIDEVKFEEIEDGLCVQMLHIGSFDDEPRSFEQMKEFIKSNNYERRTLVHKEIYLSDFRKTKNDKLKTVLRYFIK